MILEEPKCVETEKGVIQYAEYGQGPAVLCVHGAMGGYDQSLALARAIGPKGYRYIGVSRPGYLGTALEVGKSPEEQADAHKAVLDKLGVSDVIVMAISGGGPSSLSFARRYPSICEKLILCSTVAGPIPQKIPLSFTVMTMLAKVTPVMRFLQKKTEQNIEKTLSRVIADEAQLKSLLQNTELLDLFKAMTTINRCPS